MEDITELQRRIAGALDRIGVGLDQLSNGAIASPTQDDQSMAWPAAPLLGPNRSDELAEQLQASRDRCVAVEAQVADLQADLDRTRAQLADMERDRSDLRKANDHLRATSETLRHAASDHAVETHLVDDALAAEVAALKAMRTSDRSELDAIVGMLAAALEDEDAEEPDHA